jgi:hypothetical protein
MTRRKLVTRIGGQLFAGNVNVAGARNDEDDDGDD